MTYLQIVYSSQASESLTETDILEILRSSQRRNNQVKVSGLLLFSNRLFLQFIEGPQAEVEALFARIAADPRHHDLHILAKARSEQLLMPTWAMAYTTSALAQAQGDSFILGLPQALAICEVLPDHIAGHFLDYLKTKAELA